jgi:hypothetical protein
VGTSQSSNGSPGGVPMVPPWVPDVADPVPPAGDPGAPPSGGDDDDAGGTIPGIQPAPTPPPVPIAPSGRFTGARRNLGSFASDGDRGAMRRGVGQYFKGGYGGGATAVRRFGGTARTAAGLFGALSPGASTATGSPIDHAVLAGRSADQFMDAIVEAVRPVDGTQDAEASRAAIKDALSEMLDRFPDADLLSLEDEQRTFAVEQFVALDVFRRLHLDLGKVIQDKAPTASAAMARLKEVREYVKETVAASFRKLEAAGTRLVASAVPRIVRAAMTETIAVFQAYAE